jgi:hypothetical protein
MTNYQNALNQGGSKLTQWFSSLSPNAQAGVVQVVGAGLGGLSAAYTAQQKLALEQLQTSQAWQKYTSAQAPSTAGTTNITYPKAAAPQPPAAGLINTAAKGA